MMVRIVLLCFSYYFQSWNGSPFQKLGGWSTGEPVWKGALSTWASSILFRQSIFRIAPHVVANSASTIAAMSAGPRARWDGGWGRVMGCGGWWWLGVARPNDGLTKPWCLRLGSGTRDRRRGVQLHLMRKWLWAQQVGEIPRSCYLSTTHKLLETTSLVFFKDKCGSFYKDPKIFRDHCWPSLPWMYLISESRPLYSPSFFCSLPVPIFIFRFHIFAHWISMWGVFLSTPQGKFFTLCCCFIPISAQNPNGDPIMNSASWWLHSVSKTQ